MTMSTYWIKFPSKPAGCVQADDEDKAKAIAFEAMGEEPKSCQSLPYPATPRINKIEHPQWGVTPSFCFDPDRCAGKTSCPKNYSCVE
jgi:hypothetical protein